MTLNTSAVGQYNENFYLHYHFLHRNVYMKHLKIKMKVLMFQPPCLTSIFSLCIGFRIYISRKVNLKKRK